MCRALAGGAPLWPRGGEGNPAGFAPRIRPGAGRAEAPLRQGADHPDAALVVPHAQRTWPRTARGVSPARSVRARDVPARRAGSGSAGGGMGGSSGVGGGGGGAGGGGGSGGGRGGGSGGALQQPLLDSLERRDSI